MTLAKATFGLMGNTLPQAGSGKPGWQEGMGRSWSSLRQVSHHPAAISGPVFLEDPSITPGWTLIIHKGLLPGP